MAFDNTITIVGNVTRDPELRYLQSGTALCNFGVAWNNRYKDRNGEQVEEANFFDVTCWRDLADNVSASITKGDRVIVYGRLDWRSWETDSGDKRSKVEIIADEVAPSLKWATAQVEKIRRDGPGYGGDSAAGQSGQSGQSGPPTRNEPPAYDDAEEPF